VTLAPHLAAAHPEFNPLRNNRYVKIDLVGPDRVRLAYTVMFGDAPALTARRGADTNHDGNIDDAESGALGARVAEDVKRGIKLTIDGHPAAPAFTTPVVGLAGAQVAPEPLSVDLIAFFDLKGQPEHTLTVDDDTVLDQLGDAEVRIEEGPTVQVLEARRGAVSRGDKPQMQFVFRGPRFSALEDRSVTTRWTARPSAGLGDARRTVVVGGVLFGVVLLVSALALVRRYRKANG
jgi:hypothetical protein